MTDHGVAIPANSALHGSVSFGPFRLDLETLSLRVDRRLVKLGGKPLDILILLLRYAGTVVAKEALLEAVWGDVHVGDGALRVHVAALRKTLGDAGGGERFIANVAGRGYCFVAPVTREAPSSHRSELAQGAASTSSRTPPSAEIFGRDDDVQRLTSQVLHRRLTTIVGPGGVGKTTVASRVVATLTDSFDETRTIDLAPLGDEAAVATAVALAFGIHVFSGDPTEALCGHGRDRKLLLVLDSCEHVIENAALFTERLILGAPQFTILATSREALRISEERVHRLAPLECPNERETSVAAIASASAVRLFLRRASTLSDDFALGDDNATVIARICRALDGLPLAIELAAGQIDFLGVQGIAEGLDNLFALLTRGPRNAAPRQQALRATLDWSYRLLSPTEQATLRRLSVFQAPFSLSSAVAVAVAVPIATAPGQEQEARGAIADLIAKSMLTADASGPSARYRLLDTTRAYAKAMLAEAGEADRAARVHAEHVATLLADRLDLDWRGSSAPRVANGAIIEDLRAALRWAFSPAGAFDTALALATSAAFVMLEMSLFEEARSWLETGLRHLPADRFGTRAELDLRVHLNRTSPLDGLSGDNLSAILAMAEGFVDRAHMARILDMVFLVRLRVADYQGALEVAQQIDALLPDIPEIEATFCTPWMKGTACHFLGENEAAADHLTAALASPPAILAHARFSGNPALYAHCFRARTLWATGWEQQACTEADVTEALARNVGQPMLRTTALIWLCQWALWAGDHAKAERLCGEVETIATRFAMGSQRAMAVGLRGRLALHAGDPATGVEMLRDSVGHLQRYQQQMLLPYFTGSIAEGLRGLSRDDEAIAAADEAIAIALDQQARVFLPELHLIRAGILDVAPENRAAEAMPAYQSAIDSAASQGATAWEARAIVSLGHKRAGLAKPMLDALVARMGCREIAVLDGRRNAVASPM